jgi:tetratricopeptide (TPR) repeat protein
MYHDEIPALRPDQYQEIKEFLERIPPFPLDVSIAADYLKATKVSYKEYLKNLETYSNDFTSVQKNLLKEAGTTYLETRYGVITLSLKKLIDTHEDFESLLLFISLIDSQNIPRDLLDKYKNNVIVDNFIHNLRKYSFIENNNSHLVSDSTFSMHRSTQTIILAYLRKKLNLENNKELIHSIGTTFGDHLSDFFENWNTEKLRKLVSHCEIFLSHDDLLTDSIAGALSVKLGGIYAIDAYNFFPIKAKCLLEKALQRLNKNIPENSESIAQGFYFLGFASWDIGDYEKSKFFCEKSVAIYKKYFSENHLGLARTLICLSHVTRELGGYEQSKNLVEQALMIYRHHYPENHVNIAWSVSFLGGTFYELGEYEKAKKALEQSLATYEKYYPKNYMGMSRIYYYLGLMNWKLKDYEKAKFYIEKCIGISKNNFPKAKYCIECSLTILGNIYRDSHEYEKARNLLESGLVFREEFYGEEHFQTAKVLRDLGKVYLLENNIEKADAFFKRSLSIFQKRKHIEIYTTLESLAELYLKKLLLMKDKGDEEQYKYFKNQAIDYLKQALNVVKTRFPADSPHKQPIELKLKNLEGT